MMSKQNLRPCLALGALVMALGTFADRAEAQSFTARTISFETDCVGAATPGSFNLAGYKQVSSGLYASCGVASITSGGTVGTQQLHNPPIGNVSGQVGDVVLAGALSTGGGLSFGDVVIIFSPEVNELSFDVLDLNNAAGLSITLQAAGGANIPVTQPTVSSATAQFTKSSMTPIQKVTISYTPTGLLDGWFVDSLKFNVWKCGDGEIEAGANEACDDSNTDHCDTCGDDCTVTINGCSDNGTCIADGQPRPGTSGCAVCDLDPLTVGNDDDWSNVLLGQACDDGLFCTIDDQCSGTGSCVAAPRACPDVGGDLACTVGTCNEGTDQCDQAQAAGCLINNTCVLEGQINPSNECEQCNSTLAKNAWSKVAAGATCGEPSCSNGVLTPAPLCSPTGQCVMQGTQTCDGAVCADSVSCTGACQTDADCLNANHCDNGKCVPDGEPGDACKRAGECASGFCADGVCCDQACDRLCEACNTQAKLGMCIGYAAGSDPENECPDAQVCASAGLCVPEDRPNGTACDSDAVCESGHCADGFCCDSVCNSDCEACNIMGKYGSCTYHSVGSDPENECGGDAICSGTGECVSYETRGNGLCSLDMGGRNTPAWCALLALLGLGFARRRRGQA